MSPRGSKCRRVNKVAAKERPVRGHRNHRRAAWNEATNDTVQQPENVAPSNDSDATTTTTTTTTCTIGTSKSAVAACEGRSSWNARMRQPQESGLEPRENGNQVQRWPARQRRRDRITSTSKKDRSSVDASSHGDVAVSSSTSLPSPVLSTASSTDASSRRSTSPPSTVSSPARSTSSTSASAISREKPRPIESSRYTIDQDRIRKRKQERQCSARSRGARDAPEEKASTVTTTLTTCAPTSTAVSSPSPFSSSVSTTSEKVNEHSAQSSARSCPSVAHTSAIEGLRTALESYDRSRIYLAHVSFLDWRDLPGRRRTGSAAVPDAERVWVVGAADHEGHHRTRLLVTGRHWRPRCLRRVNMLSQPVIYAGGGRGSLTVDLFLWWFHREFAVTAMAMHPDGAVLVAECADYLPPEADCVAADGLVRLFVVPKDCLETRIVVKELRVRLAIGVLTRASYDVYRNLSNPSEETDLLSAYLKKFTMKEAFADFHRAWLSIRSDTFARSWILPSDRDDASMGFTSNGPSLSSRVHASTDQEDDRMLLIELQSLAREVGLEVSDEELNKWILDEESELAMCVRKKELEEGHCRVKIEAEEKWPDYEAGDEDEEEDEEEDEPTAEETVGLLSRVLTWMEREPLDPGLLLAVRSMRDTASLMASKMGLTGTHPSGLPFFCPNGDHLTQPPPAHMGIPPYGTLDAGKAAAAAGEYWSSGNPGQPPPTHPDHWKRLLAAAASTGLTRAPMYPFSTGQYPYPMLSPEMTQVAASWHTPSMYPISPSSAGFRSPYPTSLPIPTSSLPSDLYRFSPTGLMPPHPGLSPHAHALTSHALVPSTPKSDHSSMDHNHRSSVDQKNASLVAPDNGKGVDSSQQNNQDKKKPHIKKPLNAFMLYMKEMRAEVVAECTLKESAAINQILGRRWHALGREEQAKYYELARRERQLHMQLYPDWSSRANTNRTKKRKRKQDTNSDPGGNNMKKCRARYGLDQQSQWCKPCRRKKKCIRYMGEGGDGDGEADGEGEDDHSEDNLGSVGEAGTPEEDESLSSPGGLSALSSLASPSLVLPSPSSLASPCPCPLTPPVPPPPLSNNPAGQPHGHSVQQPPPHRNPVGTNPHDINNPLSVNQLTGQCIKSEVVQAPSGTSNPAISVT
ncbi:uncharacterized protein LOC128893316 isoform X2 [Hylaeus anthracinus]|uniref:uncharacterized protein LOC128893316 isoform X2 n=1 Tax=Hylaeus anthracinus TaxID=313031 RepID=UPI0023B95D5C|nr:uncharacterized protein LOC128893316 isoform X2 [Hylaeus anthracinus]